MRLQRDRRTRIVQVDAYAPGGRFQTSILGITAHVRTTGDWPNTVEIRCAAAEDDLAANVWNVPVLRGRDAVPISNLKKQLAETLVEREKVVAARKMGIDGPYIFEGATWLVPEPVVRS